MKSFINKRDSFRFKKGFFTLLGVLLAIVIVFFLFYLLSKVYFGNPSSDNKTKEFLSKQGIDASSHKTILDSTTKKIEDINKKLRSQTEELEGLQ